MEHDYLKTNNNNKKKDSFFNFFVGSYDHVTY